MNLLGYLLLLRGKAKAIRSCLFLNNASNQGKMATSTQLIVTFCLARTSIRL